SYVEYKIGPTDRPLPVSGTVSYDTKNRTLVLTPVETKYRTWKIEIVKLEPKLLIFKRLN
ncbi:MAG: hypothetical protein K2Q22_03405, partial [Cytophagales bacterium]|nr:hypothetical protein [Cytophagales bacterium]